ncbi:MAG: biopolymer transporter ExbD [Thermoanaerobaculia bacterium]|nr:biopolymer transporter ExbD [Thermoanaerobaculia bacterium]
MRLKQNRPDEEIPTSSMADIAFLLIVYFMVTTTFAATRGLDFSLPKEDDQPPIVEKEDSVLIEIRATGQIIVDQDPMEVDKIVEYLAPKLERNPKKPVIIKPDSDARYSGMVAVFDTLRQAKLHDGKLVMRADRTDLTDEEWDEGKDINISIPTQREIQSFWF